MSLTEQEVQDLINDPKLRHPYDLVKAVEIAVLAAVEDQSITQPVFGNRADPPAGRWPI